MSTNYVYVEQVYEVEPPIALNHASVLSFQSISSYHADFDINISRSIRLFRPKDEERACPQNEIAINEHQLAAGLRLLFSPFILRRL